MAVTTDYDNVAVLLGGGIESNTLVDRFFVHGIPGHACTHFLRVKMG